MPQNLDPVRTAKLVADLRAEGFETLVAEMPDTGETRIFVDAASARYNKKVRTILPVSYKRKGNRWLGVYKGKLVKGKAEAAKLLEKAKTDAKLKLRIVRKPNGVFIKSGPIIQTTARHVMNVVMQLRRKAGYEPIHKRPASGPKISRAVRKAWKEGVGEYKGIKQKAEQARKAAAK